MGVLHLANDKIIGLIQARKGPEPVSICFGFRRGTTVRGLVQLLFKENRHPGDAAASFPAGPFLSMYRRSPSGPVLPFVAGARVREHRCRPALCNGPHFDGGVTASSWRAGRHSSIAFLGAYAFPAAQTSPTKSPWLARGVFEAAGSRQHRSTSFRRSTAGRLMLDWFWLFPLLWCTSSSGRGRNQPRPLRCCRGEFGNRPPGSTSTIRAWILLFSSSPNTQHDPDLGR